MAKPAQNESQLPETIIPLEGIESQNGTKESHWKKYMLCLRSLRRKQNRRIQEHDRFNYACEAFSSLFAEGLGGILWRGAGVVAGVFLCSDQNCCAEGVPEPTPSN